MTLGLHCFFKLLGQYLVHFFWLKQRYILNKYASAIVQIVRTHTYRQTFFCFEKGFLPRAIRFRSIQQQQCGCDAISTHLHTHIKKVFFRSVFLGGTRKFAVPNRKNRKTKQGCVTNTTTIYMFFLCLTILQDSYAYALLLVASVLFFFCFVIFLNFIFINGSFASCATYYRLLPYG